jgi:two-component system response regulator YesN
MRELYGYVYGSYMVSQDAGSYDCFTRRTPALRGTASMQLAIVRREDEHRETPLIERVLAYVEEHYASPISLSDVADVFGYSACHLTTTFRQATGTPLTAWIIQRRIMAAKQLLAQGELNVAETCEAVGFSDLCYFTRQFTRFVGMTPGRFRAAKRDA